jgi:alkylation response protein AidB-like acyl-CoA dehydrogenase
MDFNFTEEQQAIADAAERVFAELCSDDTIKELGTADRPFHADLWAQLAESGMLGIVIDEAHGGLGMSLVDLCLVLESQGRFVAPIPMISCLVECAMPLDRCANESLKAELLPQVASGELLLSPVRSAYGFVVREPLTAALLEDGAFAVNGVSGMVPYAGLAQGFVVAAPCGVDDMVLFHCSKDIGGVRVTEQKTTSGEPAGHLSFDNVRVDASQVLATGEAARELTERQAQDSCVATAAVQVGVLGEGLRRTAEYVSQRKQFGRPLGAFQAVSQQAADAYMAIESLRGVYWRALDDIENGQDAALSTRVAKFWVGEAGHKAAHTILHLHGGIGQDVDYPIHRFFLWGKHLERYHGTPGQVALETGGLIAANPGAVLDAGTA